MRKGIGFITYKLPQLQGEELNLKSREMKDGAEFRINRNEFKISDLRNKNNSGILSRIKRLFFC
jgi:hypothetical protein